jgi:hypothetical protein
MTTPFKAKILVHTGIGRRELPCEVLGETKTRYVCRMLGEGLLPKRRGKKGQVVQVPKYSVTKVLTTEKAVQTEMW